MKLNIERRNSPTIQIEEMDFIEAMAKWINQNWEESHCAQIIHYGEKQYAIVPNTDNLYSEKP